MCGYSRNGPIDARRANGARNVHAIHQDLSRRRIARLMRERYGMRPGDGPERFSVVERSAVLERLPRDRAKHCTRIQAVEAKALGHGLRDRGLPRP